MRVTKDSLLRIAKETVQERAYNDSNIIAAYLTGSLLTEDPMLGGTADIDLVFVHKTQPKIKREFKKLTPDFHLDMIHRVKDEFKSPRELRGNPWLGYEMYAPMLLYEREKFFDFVQSSLRAGFEFEQPALTLQRCKNLLSTARKIWFEFSEHEDEVTPKEINLYLQSLYHAINAIAELNGAPIQERRLLIEFPARAEMLQKQNMVASVYQLLGANKTNAEQIKTWHADWKSAFKIASENTNVDERINATRLNYYDKAIKSMLDGETPLSCLWLLLHTWTLSSLTLSGDHLKFWQNACTSLGLISDGFNEYVQGLDHFLDEIEILLEEFANANALDDDSTGL
ncbi:MAG: hypothetical protein UZ14_CFX002000912 [Chloroflexi bacterium OLB14]|nr:MAG: hypothetical protein UZ14_CFX002000912 [Chloroflexi bacterium OLB14]